jgi:hypothetical protein
MPENRDRDPGDAVPPGVAVKHPAPLSEHDREVLRQLEQMGEQSGNLGKEAGRPGAEDREAESSDE